MANSIQYGNYGTQNYASTTSRYWKKQLIYYGDLPKVTFAIYKKKKLIFSPQDKFYEITKDVEFRPDLVSFYSYGLPDYWWRIMEMNDMKDILEFRSGRNIRLPSSALMQ
jgi:hypothetical protein